MSNDESQLALESTDDLLDELSRRFDNFAFIASKDMDSENDECIRKWHGSGMYCVGLCQRLIIFILANVQGHSKPID